MPRAQVGVVRTRRENVPSSPDDGHRARDGIPASARVRIPRHRPPLRRVLRPQRLVREVREPPQRPVREVSPRESSKKNPRGSRLGFPRPDARSLRRAVHLPDAQLAVPHVRGYPRRRPHIRAVAIRRRFRRVRAARPAVLRVRVRALRVEVRQSFGEKRAQAGVSAVLAERPRVSDPRGPVDDPAAAAASRHLRET